MSISKNKWFKTFVFPLAHLYLGGMILCLILSAFLGFFIPQAISNLYEAYSHHEIMKQALTHLLLIFLGEYLVRVFYQFSINKYVQVLIQKVRVECYSKWLMSYDLQESGDKASREFPLGEVLARIISDTDSLRELVTSGSFAIFMDIFFILSCFVGFLHQNLISGTFLIAMEVVSVLFLLWGSQSMMRVFLKVRKASGLMSRQLADLTAGFSQTYYTPHGSYAQKKGDRIFDHFLKVQLKANVWDAGFYSLAESLFPVFLAIMVLVFPYSQIRELALVAVMIELLQRSIQPIKDMAGKITNLQRAVTGLQRIEEFTGILESSPASPVERMAEYISLHRIEVNLGLFEYQIRAQKQMVNSDGKTTEKRNKFSLKKISFQAEKGQLIGVVGTSGCGKSTLLNILAANIIPSLGEIRIESTSGDVITFPSQYPQDLIRYKEQVGLVSQDSHLFTETLCFNITLNDKTTPDDESFQAFWNEVVEKIPYLKKWSLRPFHIVNPAQLSLGQKQLISGLRTCYLKKPIVLLDEVSSSLDSEVEEALRNLVLLIQQQALTIIVAHRVETIVKAHKILVLDEGRLESQGEHQELLIKSPVYQKFIKEMGFYS